MDQSFFCLTLVQTSLFLFQLRLLTSQRSVYAVYDSYKRQVHLVCNLLGGVALGVQEAWCTIIVVHAGLFCTSLARINQLNILNAMLAKRFNPFLFHVAFAVYLVLHVHYLLHRRNAGDAFFAFCGCGTMSLNLANSRGCLQEALTVKDIIYVSTVLYWQIYLFFYYKTKSI